MSGSEFTEWMAYYELEPFGEWRADFRAAMLATLTANINRNKEEKTEPFEIDEFMPAWDRDDEIVEEAPGIDKDTAIAAIKEYMLAMVKASGGQDLRTSSSISPIS